MSLMYLSSTQTVSRSTVRSWKPDTVASTRCRHSKAVLWVTPNSSAAHSTGALRHMGLMEETQAGSGLRQRLLPTALLSSKNSSPVSPDTSPRRGSLFPYRTVPSARTPARGDGRQTKIRVDARANSLFGWEEHSFRGAYGPRTITCYLIC